MDDEIIYSLCFNFIEYFDTTSLATIDILIKILERFSSLKSQHQHELQLGIIPFKYSYISI